MFIPTTAQLKELCELNHFPIPNDQIIFLGLRGVTPVDPDDTKFRNKHQMILSDIDYVHPRCSVLQWNPVDDKFAPFAASTVPHRRYVQKAMARSGQGANQLMTGL